jgi:hypothetical protein
MNFSQVVQAVLDITKRPDKLVETQRAVNAAVSFYCLKGEFDQDKKEASVAITANSYGGTVNIATPCPRLRRFVYINKPGALGYLTKIGADKLFTPGHVTQKDVYYLIGQELNYVLSTPASTLNVAFLQAPPVLTGTDTYWFLDVADACVIDKAASRIFQLIGDEQSMGAHNAMAREFYDAFVRDQSQP